MSSQSFASDELGVGRSGSVQCGGRERMRFFAELASSGSGTCTSAFFVGKPTCLAGEKPCGIRPPVLKMLNLGQRKGGQASSFLTKAIFLDRRLLQQYHILIRSSIYRSMHRTLSRACCHL